jgi:hypothetical protein
MVEFGRVGRLFVLVAFATEYRAKAKFDSTSTYLAPDVWNGVCANVVQNYDPCVVQLAICR